jgi:hypothetical protein
MFFLPNEFSFPPELDAALRSALWPGRRPEPEKAGQALRKLWEKLARRRGITAGGERHYSFLREEVEAYAAYYLAANALKVPLVLEEAYLLGIDPLPPGSAWLDIGTGPGTAFWGLAWWCSERGLPLNFMGWDQSILFAEKARAMTNTRPFGAQPRFLHPGKNSEDWASLLARSDATHLSFVNSLAEIYPRSADRISALAAAARAMRELSLRDGKSRWILIVEPGSRESARELAEVKDQLQADCQARVLLPCLDERPCGALSDPRDWCHEEAKCVFPDWVNEIGAKAGLRKESMIFSYALIACGPASDKLAGLTRIVSQRLERKGQVECRVCTRAGKVPVRVQRSKADPNTAFFFDAARGDLWRDAEWGPKGDLTRAVTEKARAETVFRS